MSKLVRNLKILNYLKAIRWFLLVMPVIVLFYQENGLSMAEILLLHSFFSLAIVLFEIPSGYFADKLGRKNSIIIGTFVLVTGHSLYAASHGFYGFLVSELLLGLGMSFISGADSALIFDTLKQLKKEKTYVKQEGFNSSIGNFSEGIAGLLGGALALISLRTPFIAEAAISFIGIPLAFMLVEPKIKHVASKNNVLKDLFKIVRYSLHDNLVVKWLIIYSGIIMASTISLLWFIQPYLMHVGLPFALFGLFWSLLQFSTGFFSITAYKLLDKFGKDKSILALPLIIGIGYFLLAITNHLFGAVFLFIFYFVRGVSEPIMKEFINENISSKIRATVLSVRSLVGRLIFSLIGPIIGYISDLYTMQVAFIFAAVTFSILGFISAREITN